MSISFDSQRLIIVHILEGVIFILQPSASADNIQPACFHDQFYDVCFNMCSFLYLFSSLSDFPHFVTKCLRYCEPECPHNPNIASIYFMFRSPNNH